jgi:hypothetical protein
MASSRINVNLSDLAARLDEVRSVDASGNFAGFRAFEYADLAFTLANCWSWPDEIEDIEARQLADAAILRAAKRGQITRDRLVHWLKEVTREFLRRTPNHYVIATSLLVPRRQRLANARVGSNTVTFSASLPARFDRGFLETPQLRPKPNPDPDFLKVRVHVRSRSVATAFRQASDTLDYLRGAWNFSLNRGLWSTMGSFQNRPLNKLLSGPTHTVHKADGSSASRDSYWYESFFDPSHVYSITHAERARMTRDWSHIRAACRSGAYGDDLRLAVVRYCRALDLRAPELAFVKLWGLLEFLTNTTGARYAETIRRVAFLFEDSARQQQVLEILCNYRNRSVHAGVDVIDRDNLVRLHRYVVRLLLFAFQNSGRIKSLQEMGEFLAMPIEGESLKRMRKRIDFAIRFRRIDEARESIQEGGA